MLKLPLSTCFFLARNISLMDLLSTGVQISVRLLFNTLSISFALAFDKFPPLWLCLCLDDVKPPDRGDGGLAARVMCLSVLLLFWSHESLCCMLVSGVMQWKATKKFWNHTIFYFKKWDIELFLFSYIFIIIINTNGNIYYGSLIFEIKIISVNNLQTVFSTKKCQYFFIAKQIYFNWDYWIYFWIAFIFKLVGLLVCLSMVLFFGRSGVLGGDGVCRPEQMGVMGLVGTRAFMLSEGVTATGDGSKTPSLSLRFNSGDAVEV